MIPIQKITLHKLRMRMKNPFQTSFGTLQNKELFIIETEMLRATVVMANP